ncbi:MAG: hypothetical protein M3Y81_24720 [Chloroflexota bacterium]|nr:hypothetical protein [Chloroflexota bacterium]
MDRYRILLCGLLLFAIVILSSCGGTPPPGDSATPTAAGASAAVTPAATATPEASATAPVSTPTIVPTAPPAGSVLATANNYYNAVEARNYTKAYSYMDPGVTSRLQPNQPISQDQYTRLAQGVDLGAGPVVDYTYLADSSDPTMVIMTLDRKHGLRYHSHLKMKQAGGTWKIISFDTI